MDYNSRILFVFILTFSVTYAITYALIRMFCDFVLPRMVCDLAGCSPL